MFILESDGREPEGFVRYRAYVEAHAAAFPPGALALAQSDWYFGSEDHRAPHDARLEAAVLAEHPAQDEAPWDDRRVSLTVRLRGAYDDGSIELLYPQVFAYRFDGPSLESGHRDWRYDELRLDEQGRLVHEIEWWGPRSTGRWLITASDVDLTWTPDPPPPAPSAAS